MKKWIFGCNPNNFDALDAFAEFCFVNWGTNCNVEKEDEVYIYIGAPIMKLLIKTKVTNDDVDLEDEEVNYSRYHEEGFENIKEKKKYVRLEVEKCFLGNQMKYLTFENLMKNGLNGAIRGPICLENNIELKNYIEMVEA